MQKADPFVLVRPTVCLGHSPELKPMACRLNFGALPSPLPRTSRKGLKNPEKQTNSAISTSAKVDGLVKSLKLPIFVIPAKAGIQFLQVVTTSLDSGFHRSDDFLRNHQV